MDCGIPNNDDGSACIKYKGNISNGNIIATNNNTFNTIDNDNVNVVIISNSLF